MKSDEPWDLEKKQPEPSPVPDQSQMAVIRKIEDLLKNEESSHEEIYSLYRMLPYPRVSFLTRNTLGALTRHLAIVEHKDEASMQRFLSILDDMKAANVAILRSEWSTAINFAGRCLKRVTESEVESALYIWKEMEQEAGVKGTNVTFNILINIAIQAGKFDLAEMFIKEMEARGLRFSRIFRLSMIYYHGMRHDGHGVRRAYRNFVSAGFAVDTGVMTAVIASLIRAGEPSAAEHVFLRMKALDAEKSRQIRPPSNWREARKLRLRLESASHHLKDKVNEQRKLQEATPIAPDTTTYSTIIRHHAVTSGNIDRVTELIAEMRAADIPLDGSIYISLFHGFSTFGGVRYSSWTLGRLEETWAGFVEAVEAGEKNTYFSRLAVTSALTAFAKCGDRERTLKVWEMARERWDPRAGELEAVLSTLRWLYREDVVRDSFW